MNIDQEYIEAIKDEFERICSKEDLLRLINQVKPLFYGEKTVPLDLRQLTWYVSPNINKYRYTEFKIPKKSGAFRTIHAPVSGLKAIQKALSFILQCVFEPHNASTGFVKGKSIVDNAKIHAGSNYVYNIDLKDFFPSIDQARIWKCLQLRPFNLVDSKISFREGYTFRTGVRKFVTDSLEVINYRITGGRLLLIDDKKGYFNKFKTRLTGHIIDPAKAEHSAMLTDPELRKLKKEYKKSVNDILTKEALKYIHIDEGTKKQMRPSRLELANVIASLCCMQMEVERRDSDGSWIKVSKNVLPQGAPTSPVLTNIVCQRLDYLLTGIAKRFGLKYSRYADDITFSSMHNVYQLSGEFVNELHRIIREQGFQINEKKTRLQKQGYRQEVTGLVVNQTVNVQKRYIKQVRLWLYYWERYGYNRANSFFTEQYVNNKGYLNKRNPGMANVISGKLNYLKMVKGAENSTYLSLYHKYVSLAVASNHIIEANPSVLAKEIAEQLPVKLDKYTDGNKVVDLINKRTKQAVLPMHLPIKHNPKRLVSLLKRFSINDSALKYTTHSWEAGRDSGKFKDLTEFLNRAKKEYAEFSYELKNLSDHLNGKIFNFLFNPKVNESGWGVSRVKFGWSSPELIQACEEDENLKPEDFRLPEPFRLIDSVQRELSIVYKFSQVIDLFKNEIEIRDESSVLLNLILDKHENYLGSFGNPQIENLNNKTFYTDVQWLSKALDLIFESIRKRPQHNQVIYSISTETPDSITLKIIQKGSFNKGKSVFDEKLALSTGDFSEIATYLTNLCDWSIESRFKEGNYRINYLASEDNVDRFEKIEEPVGFTYLLTFYK